MSSSQAGTVALIDPIWVGHHPMYFSQFIASFLRCGARVIGMCPDPGGARDDLAAAVGPELASDLHDRVCFEKLPTGGRSFFGGRFEGDPARTFMRWKTAADCLREVELATGLHADMVYFPYLDSYLRFLPLPMVPDMLLARPWSGLYLRNHHHGERPSAKKVLRLMAKGDAILRSRYCLGVGVLDERFIPTMEKLTGKPITAYPDVTDASLPSEPFGLATAIKRRAAGRKVIGMIGLERRKGVLTMIRTAKLSRERGLPFYFACAGRVFPGEYSPEESSELDEAVRGIADGSIDNLHFDPTASRIRSEADFNDVFRSFDVAWVAYEGFQGSSGTLGKAAMFEIPCVATKGECIGRRVEEYHLGITIDEATPAQALEGIRKLAQGLDSDGSALEPRFAEYRDAHSKERLDRILADLLGSAIGSAQSGCAG